MAHSDNVSRNTAILDAAPVSRPLCGILGRICAAYKDNPTIAGYNVMNEPITNAPRGRFSSRYTPKWDILNRVYRRVVDANPRDRSKAHYLP